MKTIWKRVRFAACVRWMARLTQTTGASAMRPSSGCVSPVPDARIMPEDEFMRSIVLTCLLTSTIVLAACSTPRVEQSPHTAIAGAIRVDGDVSSKTLAAEDLEQLQPTDVSWTHKGET